MMRSVPGTVVLVVVVASAGLVAAATQVQMASSWPAAATAELDRVIEAERVKAHVPGLSVAVGWRGGVVYSKGFGQADLESDAAATPATLFRTASIAKPLTATAIMQLADAGALALDDDVQRHCRAFPRKPWPVTIRQVLGHQSGIRHYQKPGESTGTAHHFTIDDSLALFKDDALQFEPGTRYLYSTYGYSVLGCVIEGASGQPYDRYMQQRVFAPAGMTATRLDRHWDVIPGRARGYQQLTAEALATLPPTVRGFAEVGGIYNASLHDTSMKVPGGGLLSTSADLVRFSLALLDGGVVSATAREAMWTEGKTRDGTATGYGLGWGVTPPQDGIRRLTHSGNQAGAAGVLHVLPEVGLSYAILTNLEDTQLGPLSRAIAGVLRTHLMTK